MRDGQVIFTYFHFAADESLTRACLKAGVVAIAYETVELSNGELPLLTPMSEVAGRMAVQEGARYLEKPQGGLGVLLGGVPGVLPGKVLILGGGVVGTNAAKMAAGLGSRVLIMSEDPEIDQSWGFGFNASWDGDRGCCCGSGWVCRNHQTNYPSGSGLSG